MNHQIQIIPYSEVNPVKFSTKWLLSFVLILMITSAAGTSSALQWVGDNGIFRLSFSQDDPYDNQRDSAKFDDNGIIHLWGWITDLDRIAFRGEELVTIDGLEIGLQIEGSDYKILAIRLPGSSINISKKDEHIIGAFLPGVPIVEKTVQLVEWEIKLINPSAQVTLGLGQEYLSTCATSTECEDSGTFATYMGEGEGRLGSFFFGAGYVPAFIGAMSEEDKVPCSGVMGYSDVGLFQRVE